MPGVQFGQQIDMNSFKVTEMGPGVAGTDGVNVNQLLAASPDGFAQSVGDGVATSFNVDHNLGTADVLVQVFRNSDGVSEFTDVARTTVNRVVIDFGLPPALNAYRVVVIPVP